MRSKIKELTGIIALANIEIKGGAELHPDHQARASKQASKDMFLVMAYLFKRKFELN
jgi:hypothetical protein